MEIFIQDRGKAISIQAPGIGNAAKRQKFIALLEKAITKLKAESKDDEIFLNEIVVKK